MIACGQTSSMALSDAGEVRTANKNTVNLHIRPAPISEHLFKTPKFFQSKSHD